MIIQIALETKRVLGLSRTNEKLSTPIASIWVLTVTLQGHKTNEQIFNFQHFINSIMKKSSFMKENKSIVLGDKRIGETCRTRTGGFCLLFAVICIMSFSLVSCDNSNQRSHGEDGHDTIVAISNQLQEKERITMQDLAVEAEYDTISFFGEHIVMDDWTGILHQIQMIAEKDSMLTYTTDVDTRVLNVCGVGFGVNVHGDNSIVLISSTEVDDPRIIPIVKYLNDIYGEAYEGEPDNYWWGSDGQSSAGATVRLRPLHSEEGGTVIMFN